MKRPEKETRPPSRRARIPKPTIETVTQSTTAIRPSKYPMCRVGSGKVRPIPREPERTWYR
jgi:hypothetical protein